MCALLLRCGRVAVYFRKNIYEKRIPQKYLVIYGTVISEMSFTFLNFRF